jgi:hypothetical protein
VTTLKKKRKTTPRAEPAKRPAKRLDKPAAPVDWVQVAATLRRLAGDCLDPRDRRFKWVVGRLKGLLQYIRPPRSGRPAATPEDRLQRLFRLPMPKKSEFDEAEAEMVLRALCVSQEGPKPYPPRRDDKALLLAVEVDAKRTKLLREPAFLIVAMLVVHNDDGPDPRGQAQELLSRYRPHVDAYLRHTKTVKQYERLPRDLVLTGRVPLALRKALKLRYDDLRQLAARNAPE